MKKQWTVVLVFLAFIVWQIVSPYYTVYQIKQAVEQQRSTELTRYIDFVLLKRNLKAQLQEKLEQKIALPQDGSFFGSLTYTIASEAIDGMLNHLITPNSMITVLSNVHRLENDLKRIDGWSGIHDQHSAAEFQPVAKEAVNTAPVSPAQHQNQSAHWQYHFDSMNQFSIIQQYPDRQPVRYVLTRSGLGWKLSNIILP